MSVFFIGCPHLGHRNIAKYRPFVSSTQENTDMIVSEWRERVHKRDVVYVMGDAAFDDASLDVLSWLPGRKILIKGNHDDFVSTDAQKNVFEEIHGMLKYKGMWLTHCPIHPDELRGKNNLHAHVHQKSIMRRNLLGRRVLDKRYLNTCVDALFTSHKSLMIELNDVKKYFGKQL